MKKYLLISMMMIALAACNKSAEPSQSAPATPAPSNTSAVSTPDLSSGSLQQTAIRADYQKQCVINALGGKAASTPEQHDLAYNKCDCVYEESVKAFGDQAAWEEKLDKFDPKNPDPKVKEISEQAIQTCSQKHAPKNAATASASASQ